LGEIPEDGRMVKYCTKCDEKTIHDETAACFVCGEKLFSAYTKAQRYWFDKSNDEIKLALGSLKEHDEENRRVIQSEGLRRDLLYNMQVTNLYDLNIPFSKMIFIAFKWISAIFIAMLPFALIIVAATCAMN
jgi:ribosomal protein L37E